MFTYDWIKENPGSRDNYIQENWVHLFTNPNTSHSIKAEIQEASSAGFKLTDAFFFWNRVRLLEIIESDIKDCAWFKTPTIQTWLEYAYTYFCNLDACHTHNIMKYNLYRMLSKLSELDEPLQLNYSDAHKIIAAHTTAYIETDIHSVIVRALAPQGAAPIGAGSCKKLYDSLALDFIKRLTAEQVTEILNLLDDSEYAYGHKFNSMNEIRECHDATIIKRVRELYSNDVDNEEFVYDKSFLQYVQEHGLIAPPTPLSLLTRGKQHNNCVGTYLEIHRSEVIHADTEQEVRRVLFTNTATLELRFTIAYSMIICAHITQYKTAYNRDIDKGKNLYDLCVALTGKPADILHVKTIKQQK